jgi:hypothetical protein
MIERLDIATDDLVMPGVAVERYRRQCDVLVLHAEVNQARCNTGSVGVAKRQGARRAGISV